MIPMLRKALWDLRWAAFWYALGGAAYTLMVALFYPTIREQAEPIHKLLATYPKGLLAAFGVTDITSFSGFMGAESLNVIWPAIVVVFATLSGAGVVAKEVEDGTAELWLSVPADRWRLLLAKMAALGVGLLEAVVACVAAVLLSAAIVGVTLKPAEALALGVVMAVFLCAIASYSCLLSALTSSRGQAAGVSLGITVASYLAWVMASLSDSWKWLKQFSLFTAYTPQKAIEGQIDVVALGVLVLITGLCTLGAIVAFERRDAV